MTSRSMAEPSSTRRTSPNRRRHFGAGSIWVLLFRDIYTRPSEPGKEAMELKMPIPELVLDFLFIVAFLVGFTRKG